MTITMKIKNIVLAIDAAPAAMPENPNIAATIAIRKNMAVHFNIKIEFGYFLLTQTANQFFYTGKHSLLWNNLPA